MRVPRGDGTFFDLDLRTPYGTFDNFGVGSPVTVGVTVRLGQGTASPTYTPQPTLLLDSTPHTSDLKDAPLAVGKTMTDPVSNLSITAMSVDANGIVVRVREGNAPSAPGNPSATATRARVSLAWSAGDRRHGGRRLSRQPGRRRSSRPPPPARRPGPTRASPAGATYTYTVAAVDTSTNVGPAASVGVTVPTAGRHRPSPGATASPTPTATPAPTAEPVHDAGSDGATRPRPRSRLARPPVDTAAPTAPGG